MCRLLVILLPGLLAACSVPSLPSESTNRWTDDRLAVVLEAREHRDSPGLCALLGDSSHVVREAAALAFASVQDSAGIPCLLRALSDPNAAVRSTAVFALGFIADSLTVQEMAGHAMSEQDSTVQRAYLRASFLAMQRRGLLKEPGTIINYLESAPGQDRARAADALRRLPDSAVVRAKDKILGLMGSEGTEVRQFLILAMRKFGSQADRDILQRLAVEQPNNGERVNALRVCGALEGIDDEFFFHAIGSPITRQAALEVLRMQTALDAKRCLHHAEHMTDTTSMIALLGLAVRHGADSARVVARRQLDTIAAHVRSPYLRAAIIDANATLPLEDLLVIMTADGPAIVRQAAFAGAVRNVREMMMRARFASREAQYTELGRVIAAAVRTGDAGLISSVAELLQEEEPEVIGVLLPPALEQRALHPLHPIRDLEARQLLLAAVAQRDALADPPHQRPTFNHPIDLTKLAALEQGQRYRILTNKGEIIIATDVNDCPGSSLAFDSLVTAGYYNGRSFHRVVPNFVVQGGCPRGDGYGGMPWTLRTEIGRAPFTEGSVGLASAGPDTESCQFFITHSAAPHLDGRYTRFGQVVSGMEVVWRIAVGDRMVRVERAD